MGTADDTLGRRQILQAGAALLVTHEACRGARPGPLVGDAEAPRRPAARPDATQTRDATVDARMGRDSDTGVEDALPEATLVPDGGTCPQTDYTHPVSIVGANLAERGTSIAFFDDRYLDPVCSGSRILVIHPVTREAYVALSGVCTHLCCDFTGGEGGPSYVQTYTLSDGGVLDDVVECTCHGSLFSALDGSVLSGPGGNPLATGLEVLPTCEGGGYVFVSIPPRPT
jgi:nitrite reductase/ring-hydroxylating ferredoxin subunit